MKSIITACLLFSFIATSAQEIFDPPSYETKRKVGAVKATEEIVLDGILNENTWKTSPVASDFIQSRPDQGKKATQETEVRIAYDEVNLYISAICYEPQGKKGIFIQDLRRDFSYSQNELFSVSFDPFQDVRNPIPTFQIGPYGNQRDLLIFDDRVFDTDWDAIWSAKCTINAESWVVEMAIPWASLRYPAGATEWGINFNRNIRKLNEHTGWSPWPRAYTVGRMQYGGLLQGIHPPDPNLNLRVQPYVLVDESQNRGEQAKPPTYSFKAGGEVKWAVTPNTIADLTVNTDFAQADVDRQVVNLTRSSIFFPERRQFFLENATLFSTGENGIIQPFFSRAVGLSPTGKPLPIHAGARVIHQDSRKSYGALMVTQEGEANIRNTQFGTMRYLQNVGNKFRFGGMLNYRNDNLSDGGRLGNVVGTSDFFYRPSQPLNVRGMISVSNDDRAGNGLAYLAGLEFSKNWIIVNWLQVLSSSNYLPATGFTARKDFVYTNPSVEFLIQKDWLPKKVWYLGPTVKADVFHQTSTGAFQESDLQITPVRIVFRNLSSIGFTVNPVRQSLQASFSPLPDITFAVGDYSYLRYQVSGETNMSAPYSLQASASTGGYFDGQLNNVMATARVAPLPQVALSVTYTANWFTTSERPEAGAETHLIAPELRLALNPVIQLSTFYQYNTAIGNGSLNARFSWQYRPLSFVYLVFNSNRAIDLTPEGIRNSNQSAIFKVSYIKQF